MTVLLSARNVTKRYGSVRALDSATFDIEEGVTVGEAGGEIALVGLRAHVEQDVPAGGRFPEMD